MKKVTALTIGFALLGTSFVFAQGASQPVQPPVVQAEAAKLVEVGNKICPVSGEKVPGPGEKSAMGGPAKFEYNGKIYNLCCKMCKKDFLKDPDKYIAKVNKELEAEKSQTK